jgi:hypothetical protein
MLSKDKGYQADPTSHVPHARYQQIRKIVGDQDRTPLGEWDMRWTVCGVLTLVITLAQLLTGCRSATPLPEFVPAGAATGQNTFVFLYTDT